ncbi:PREDICTED: uncharacterized protein LOC105461585, partial [Wasmannia auropunctata]|uniref:uncharacterized protein LOC105461585 n=1 Tax=Wasmannia auropunctata TaxID=64793 RepID=UPI0005EDCB8E
MNNDALIAIINDFVDSSDDQSDSESDDELLIDPNKVIRGKRPRLHYLDIIALYDDQEFKSNFRLRRDTFGYILDHIRPDLEKWQDHFGRYPIPASKQFYIALWMLATPDSY